MSFAPNSLAMRMIAILAITLLTAQSINFYLLTEQRRAAAIRNTTLDAIERFVDIAAAPDALGPEKRSDTTRRPRRGLPPRPGFRDERRPGGFPPDHHRPPPDQLPVPLPRDGVIWISDHQLVIDVRNSDDRALRKRVIKALTEKTVKATSVSASYVPSPMLDSNARAPNPNVRQEFFRSRTPPPYEVRLSALLPETGEAVNSRFPAKPPPIRLKPSEYVASASVFALSVLIAIGVLVINIGRPLKDLSAAAGQVGRRNNGGPMPVRGPSEVRDAIQTFNEMNDRVSELLIEKDVMLGALGHDLRTPLTALRLRVEKMQPVEYRKQAIQSLDDMSKLIEDILELTRGGSEEEKLSVYDIRLIVQDVVADYEDLGKNVTIADSPRVVARCKPAAIQRMMRNLIDNALEYAGRASVRLQHANDMARIIVEDDGPGIPDDSIEKVLLPFRRGDLSRNRSSGGAGLGLAIAKTIAQAHGGDLELQNKKPRGLRAEATISAKA